MNEIKVAYTLDEVKEKLESRYEKVFCTRTCRIGDEQGLLGATIHIIQDVYHPESKVAHYVCLTSDNYLVNSSLMEDSYGTLVKSELLGMLTGTVEVRHLFDSLPESCKDGIRVLDYLNRDPAKLVDKLSSVLNHAPKMIKEQDKIIEEVEQMTVNSFHNMKKQPKEMFRKAWLGNFTKVLDRLPWLKNTLEEDKEV